MTPKRERRGKKRWVMGVGDLVTMNDLLRTKKCERIINKLYNPSKSIPENGKYRLVLEEI